MIVTTISYKDNLICNLKVVGHASSAPYGQDLVCAGVSAILVGGVNALLLEDKLIQFKVEEGFLEVINVSKESRIQTILLTIVTQLKTVKESYGKYIKIVEENL